MTEMLHTPDTFYHPSESELIALAKDSGALDGTALVPLPGGHHNVVYRYGDIVLRYPKTASGSMSIQAEFDALVELNGTRTPRAIDSTFIGETPITLIEFVDGVHKDFNTLTPDEIEEFARAMTDFHNITSDRFSPAAGAKPTASGTHADYVWAMIHESITDRLQSLQDAGADLSPYLEADLVIADGLQKLDAIVADHPEDFVSHTFGLLHHDLNPENVIWKSDGSAVLIDPNPTYGDPLDDISYAVVNNGGSVDFQKTLLEAYRRVAQCGDISAARMEAYALKNGLDDLAWTIEMIERHPAQRTMYEERYAIRLRLLDKLLNY